jgi:hypothetical protein
MTPRSESERATPQTGLPDGAKTRGAKTRWLAALSALSDSRLLCGCALAVICTLVALRGMQPIRSTDLGWHLALGRYIVETGGVPTTEPFSHTARGVPMVAHEWLSQTIYHGVVQLGGLLSLRALHAALAVAMLLFLFWQLRRQQVPRAFSLLGVFLYLAVAQARFQVRPQMFDLACLLLLYSVVFVSAPALRARQLVVIIAGTALWANLHSGAVLFAALVAIYVGVELAQQWSGWRAPLPSDLGRGEPKRLVALAIGLALAVFATPHHLRIVPYVLESGRINREMSMEWLPLLEFWGHPAKPPWALEAYLLIALGFVWAAVSRLRRGEGSFARVGVVAFTIGLAFYSQRFVVLAFAALLYGLPELSRRAAATLRPERRRALAVAAFAVVVGLIPAVLWPRGPLDGLAKRFSEELSFRPSMFPQGAMGFLSDVELTGKLFNPSKWGGYVLYRSYDRYPIFVDGRWVTLGQDLLADSQVIARRKPGAFRLLDDYGVDLVLVHRGWMTSGMRERNTWIPLFENLNAGVYLLRDPRNAGDLERVVAYYRSRDIPFDPAVGFDEQAAYSANRGWADRMDVSPWHLDQSQSYGDNTGSVGSWVRGW